MTVAVIVGTRPEIIKQAPVIFALEDRGILYTLIHTAQHYDENLSKVFFEELGLREPDHLLEVGSGSKAQQTATVLVEVPALSRDDRLAILRPPQPETVFFCELSEIQQVSGSSTVQELLRCAS